MKKFYKYSLIIAGILAAAGLVLCLFCGFMGGRAWKKLVRTQKVVEQMAKLSDDLGFHVSFGDGNGIYIGSEENDVTVGTGDASGVSLDYADGKLMVNGEEIVVGKADYEVPTDGLTALVAELGAGSFEIRENTALTDTIQIHISGIGNWNYTVEGGMLRLGVRQESESFRLGDLTKIADCVIELPQGFMWEEVVTDVGAGELSLDGVCAEQMLLEVGAGQIRAGQVKSDSLRINVGAGQATCKNMESKEVALDVSMGECIYKGTVEDDLAVDCATGNVELHVNGKETDRNYDISCSMGNIDIGDMSMVGIDREVHKDNGAEHTFTISCSMGNVTVDFED